MRVFKVSFAVHYHALNSDLTISDIFIAAESTEVVEKNKYKYVNVIEDNDWFSGDFECKIISIKDITEKLIVRCSAMKLRFVVPILGERYYEFGESIDKALKFFTEDDDRFFQIRQLHIFLENIGKFLLTIYYIGKDNSANLRAIQRCIDRGIDPYGVD